jgi:transposase
MGFMNKEQKIQKAIELYINPKKDGSYYVGTEIADMLGVHSSTIYYWLRKNNIKPDRQGINNVVLTEEQIVWAVEQYTTPLKDGTWVGSKTIADELGVATRTVIYHLKRNGIKIRPPKERLVNGKACKPRNRPVGEAPMCVCGCDKKTKWVSKENSWQAYYPGHYCPQRPFHEKSFLIEEYVNKQRNAIDIANDFGVHQTTIIRWLKKHNIPRRTQAESLRLSGKVRGKNNPAWKGGVADWDYSHDWKSICKEIKNRDKWTCQKCGKTKKRWGHSLHVHHIDEDKTNNNFNNLISLCSECHAESHGYEIARDYYRYKLKTNYGYSYP